MGKILELVTSKRGIKTIAAAIILLFILGGSGWYWWIGTPEYSMMQLRSAVEHHDTEKAFHYIDYDKVFDGVWETVVTSASQEAVSSTKSGDGFEGLGNMIGISLMQAMKPAMKGAFRTGLEDAIKGNSSPDTATSSQKVLENIKANKITIQRHGSDATVDLGSGISLLLNQTTERYWKIVQIKGLDTSSVPSKS